MTTGGGSTPELTGWKKQIGTLVHVSSGDDGEVWGITAERGIRRWNEGEWQPVPGALSQISVGSIDHIWGVADQGEVFYWYGDWRQVTGNMVWVSAAADGTVWGLNLHDDIFRWNGASWDQIDGKLRYLSVASRQAIWGANRDHEVFRWNGGGWDRRAGEVAGTLSVGLRNGHERVWAMGMTGSNLAVGPVPGPLFESWDGGTWEPRDGRMTQMSVSSQFVLGVNSAGEVHSWGYDLPKITRPLVRRQGSWRWCNACQGLFFGGNSTRGNCPVKPRGAAVTAVQPHDPAGSAEYALANANETGQAGWRWCRKCEGLFWGNGNGGRCPSGAAHDGSQSAVYTMIHDPSTKGQEGWRFCNKCEGLFFAGSGAGRCPAGGGHDPSVSAPYRMRMVGG